MGEKPDRLACAMRIPAFHLFCANASAAQTLSWSRGFASGSSVGRHTQALCLPLAPSQVTTAVQLLRVGVMSSYLNAYDANLEAQVELKLL